MVLLCENAPIKPTNPITNIKIPIAVEKPNTVGCTARASGPYQFESDQENMVKTNIHAPANVNYCYERLITSDDDMTWHYNDVADNDTNHSVDRKKQDFLSSKFPIVPPVNL